MVTPEPYQKRSIRFVELWHCDDWRMKLYSITCRDEQPDDKLIGAAKEVAAARLKSVADEVQHYGVGFIGVHEGRTSNFVFIDFWANENELHHHVYVSPLDAPTEMTYVTPTGLTACVWDLRVMAFERQAWVDTILNAGGELSLDAYLNARLNEDV